MKKSFIKTNLLLLLMLAGSSLLNAQATEGNVKSTLSTIFDFSVNQNFNKAAGLILYENGNEKRAYNASDKSELKDVMRECKRIKAYINLSDSYDFSNFSQTKVDGIDGAVIEVTFKSGDQKINVSFSFVNLSGKLLLASIK